MTDYKKLAKELTRDLDFKIKMQHFGMEVPEQKTSDIIECGCGCSWIPMYSATHGYMDNVERDDEDNLFIECPGCHDMIRIEG